YRQETEDKQRAAGMTFREAYKEFWEFAERTSWNPRTTKQNKYASAKHLEPTALMDMPIDTIRAIHIEQTIGNIWRSKGSTGKNLRSLVHSTLQYQIDKDDGVYRGPNPASWREKSTASKLLGEQPPSRPHAGAHPDDVPKLVAHFCGPQDHWIPG